MTKSRYALPLHVLARRAGVKHDTMRDHLKAGAPTPPADKKLVATWVASYAAWREDRRATPAGGGDNRTPGERTWSERGAQARALSTIFDLQVRQSKYVLREAVDDQRTRQVQAVVAALDAMARMAGTVFGAEVQTWIERECRAICDRFADDDDEREVENEANTVASAGEAWATDGVEHENAGDAGIEERP